MKTIILTAFFLTVLLRLISSVISGINERKLKKMGAVEFGQIIIRSTNQPYSGWLDILTTI